MGSDGESVVGGWSLIYVRKSKGCLLTYKIPESWKTAEVISLFKKGEHKLVIIIEVLSFLTQRTRCMPEL
jgi:hypothetical protein